MPEIVIKYKNKRTLEALMDIAKYFKFSVVSPKLDKQKHLTIKGVSVIPADKSIDTKDLEEIFSSRNIDAKQLRKEAWLRN